MKKIVLSLAVMLTLTACPSPGTNNGSNTGTNNGTNNGSTVDANGNFATKAQFIAFLNCLKSSASVDASVKGLIDMQISAVSMIPDSSWAMSAAASTEFAKAYMEIAKTNGCVN